MAHTLSEAVTYQEDIRKSRFLVHAAPVQTPDEAMEFIALHAQPAATHNCWAWKIGQAYRFNDDGEPGGTAGKPILLAIEGQDLDRVVVLVVRWFGGIKLGTGGLVRAYGGAAAQCLRLAPKTELLDLVTCECHCVFSDMAVVQSKFSGFGIQVIAEQFTESGVVWTLGLPRTSAVAFGHDFANLTRGQGRFYPLDVECSE